MVETLEQVPVAEDLFRWSDENAELVGSHGGGTEPEAVADVERELAALLAGLADELLDEAVGGREAGVEGERHIFVEPLPKASALR